MRSPVRRQAGYRSGGWAPLTSRFSGALSVTTRARSYPTWLPPRVACLAPRPDRRHRPAHIAGPEKRFRIDEDLRLTRDVASADRYNGPRPPSLG
ncbi:hypothetical protein HPB50_014347 [Hyalomma asiaticum]|uniref:Uncharacterized protein n=1 Tax=Hyalomma asiaticum TaxID=266040 RepID=A0ACB7SHX1_HYAAI|nr:hypothetical protein HPB50_014347 [Hyalomma asiaticum]